VSVFYELFDREVEYSFIGKGRQGDPGNWVADISTLKKLGYQQQHELPAGLKKYYEWIKAIDKGLA
jgi:dTDP-glucose 4,6-dehydratase/UDP-glucose 4-epimerase